MAAPITTCARSRPTAILWVIDRRMAAHPSSVPPQDRFLEGEAEAMIADLAARIGPAVALVHYDLGIGVAEQDEPLGRAIAAALPSLVCPGAVIVANRALPGFEPLPVPPEVPEKRYFLHRYCDHREL